MGPLALLSAALSNVDPAIVRSLVVAGARGSLRDIGFSIDGGQAARDVVRVLVDHGIDINQFDDWARTPLMWAAEYAELETVRFMIELGADVHRVAEENMNGVHTRDTALAGAQTEAPRHRRPARAAWRSRRAATWR